MTAAFGAGGDDKTYDCLSAKVSRKPGPGSKRLMAGVAPDDVGHRSWTPAFAGEAEEKDAPQIVLLIPNRNPRRAPNCGAPTPTPEPSRIS